MTLNTNPLDRGRVLMSVQRALLMAITPEIRTIDVSWSDCEIRLRFTLAEAGDTDMNELTNEVEAEVEADFIPEARVHSEVDIVPTGTPVSLHQSLDGGCARVFARREIA